METRIVFILNEQMKELFKEALDSEKRNYGEKETKLDEILSSDGDIVFDSNMITKKWIMDDLAESLVDCVRCHFE